jgi:hypothetical protein
MVELMSEMEDALSYLGYPTSDVYELPDSEKRFPDGAHFRNEVAGIEDVAGMEALAEASEKRNVPIHRVIATVGGATLRTFAELREMAQIAAEKKYEVIVTPFTSRGWDGGRQYATPEGYVSGMRVRGMDHVCLLLKDIERSIEAGFRGFLVCDEGVLSLLSKLREKGTIPKDIIFKCSVFAGHGSPVGAKLLEALGADTFNPLADLTFPMLASIRKATKLPLDIYVALVDAMGGFYRFSEAAEIARISAPVYFKFEPGKSEADIYKTWVPSEYKADLVREKVRQVQCLLEWVERLNPAVKCSKTAPGDLRIPQP